MKGYKVFNPDFTCKGMQFAANSEFKLEGKIELYSWGIHFCKNLTDCFSYYRFDPNNIVCEVTALGEVIESQDDTKVVTNIIKVGKKLSWEEVLSLVNSGNYNSGKCNSGYHNSGDRNSGNGNSGYRNSGDYNSGDYNSGYCNSGDYNSGYCNLGNHNSGNYNSGDCNSGHFNTTKPTVRLFNKDTGKKESEIRIPLINLSITEWIPEHKMTAEQKRDNLCYKSAKGFLLKRTYHEAWKIAWENLSQEEKRQFLELPNFDENIFKEITGIDLKDQK